MGIWFHFDLHFYYWEWGSECVYWRTSFYELLRNFVDLSIRLLDVFLNRKIYCLFIFYRNCGSSFIFALVYLFSFLVFAEVFISLYVVQFFYGLYVVSHSKALHKFIDNALLVPSNTVMAFLSTCKSLIH